MTPIWKLRQQDNFKVSTKIQIMYFKSTSKAFKDKDSLKGIKDNKNLTDFME